MLQISSFLIAPPSLLLLCMYPLPLPNTAMLCPAMPSPCYAVPFLAMPLPCAALLLQAMPLLFSALLCPCCATLSCAFALLCRALPCLALALPCYAELIYAFALLSAALPCYALALRRKSLHFGVWPCLCCPLLSFALPSLCYACPCAAMQCPCFALSRQADLCNAFALPCKGKFSSLRFGNRYISPFFPRLTQPVGQTFARQNQTAQPLLKLCLCLAVQCFPSQCLRHVFLGFAMPLPCAALLLQAMPLPRLS